MLQTPVGQFLHFVRTNRTVSAIIATTAFTMMGQGVISPVLPLIARGYGVSLFMVGVMVAVFGLGRFFVNVPTGVLADRYGRRFVMLVGLMFVVASGLMMVALDSFLALLAFRFLSGIGTAMYITGVMIVLADISTQANRARYVSLQQGSIILGSGIGPVIGGYAAELWGFRSTFYLMSGLSIIGLAVAFLRMPETSRSPGEVKGRDTLPEKGEDVSPAPERSGFLSVLTNRNMVVVGMYFFMVVFTRNGTRASILPLVGDVQAGLGPGQIGLAFTLMMMINFALVVPSAFLSDKLGRKRMMLPGGVVSALGLVLFVFSTNFSTYLLAAVVSGIGTGIVGPSPMAFVADIAPPGTRGLTIGVFRSYGDLGGIVGPVLLGWMVDISTFGWALNTNAVLVVGSALVVMLMAREVGSAPRREPG